MLFDMSQKLFSRSDHVKGIDFHPTEPWLLTGLYNGTVASTTTNRHARKDIQTRLDDFQLRMFNYNTHDKVALFEAHPDYIRCLAVHLTASIVLTGSDDMTIKAWDWDKQWKNIQSLGSPHDKGINDVDFYPSPDCLYLTTTRDDKTIKVWDYLPKSCIQTMEGCTNNPSFAVFHPNLPIIISGSEDGTIKIWNNNTYRLENTLSYALERTWCVALHRDANNVAMGFNEGIVVIKLGPTYSMDPSGKLIYTRNQVVFSGSVQTLSNNATAEGN
ncbi:hypothetical protein SCLCIDRAFT_26857 [Scleroderma citrinum Foug A]|uniref:Uncharacterized protein n=1 Tax=Scleroderma citrinum Foug A TaxID=1036808 RepID=A0A0C3DH99_9AGAM|nr:hypothetical protein SCLCIDRAFT_26857 [Scleroderma citrinum Foug A]